MMVAVRDIGLFVNTSTWAPYRPSPFGHSGCTWGVPILVLVSLGGTEDE